MHLKLQLRLILELGLLALFVLTATAGAIDIETVLVGNPGNAADTRVMNDGTTGYGDVAYEYRIGKFEVTNDQYAAFLRSVAYATDPYALYALTMSSTLHGGIVRTGVDGGYTYTVKPNMGNKPVTNVSFWDAARFANWMHHRQPVGPPSAATTEDGTYALNGITTFGGASIARKPGANWFIPSDDEWFKAAFYDPRSTAQGGPPGNDHYWLYATRSDATPVPATANSVGDISNPGSNVVNYNNNARWNDSGDFGNVTTVGSAGPLSASYYGTHDQSGNFVEFNENNAATGQAYRTLRGGSFGNVAYWTSGAERTWTTTSSDAATFRLASVLNPPGPIGGLTGDYNRNGFVDAADYVVWRNTLNQIGDGLPADGNGNGQIDTDDYQVWRSNFGRSGAAATAALNVPEPTSIISLLLGSVSATLFFTSARRLQYRAISTRT